MGFEAMITLFTVDRIYHHWLILCMKIRRAMMERTVQVLDGGGYFRSRTYRVCMHGLLLWLTKGGKLRGRMREGMIWLIEVWSLLTRHSEDRLVLLCGPSRRLWSPIAVAWLRSTSTIWCLSWHSSYLSSLWLFEWQHLLVVRRTLHSTRTWLLIADSPWVVPLWVSILEIVAIFSNCREATIMIFWCCVTSFFARRCL